MNIDTDPTPPQGTQRPLIVLDPKIRSLIASLRDWHEVTQGQFSPSTIEFGWIHFSQFAAELGTHNVLVTFSAARTLHLIDYTTGQELR